MRKSRVPAQASSDSSQWVGPFSEGPDVIYGTELNDTLDGAGGNDTIFGGDGGDLILGGLGDDVIRGEAGSDQLSGDDGNDTVIGGSGSQDVLYGEGGDDWLYAEGTDVSLYGGLGSDTLRSTAGNDVLDVEGDPDDDDGLGTYNEAYAGAGNDELIGGGGEDRLYGEADNDYLWGYASADTLYGGGGVDNLLGGEDQDSLSGGDGNDSLLGQGANDTLNGGAGADQMQGGVGDDVYYIDSASDVAEDFDGAFEGGIDLVISGIGATTLTQYIENLRLTSLAAANGTGNALENTIWAGEGDNVINGLGGEDTVSYAVADAGVTVTLNSVASQNTYGSGFDTLLNIEHLAGSGFYDHFTGNGLANVLEGGAGNDTLLGSGGNDSLYGGADTDRLDGGSGDDRLDGGGGALDVVTYANAMSGITVNLALATAQATGGSGTDTLVNVEWLIGSGYADNLRGNALANRIEAGNGSDWILGGGGVDTLMGGIGADIFVWTTAGESINGASDVILDFNRFQSDKLDVSRIDANASVGGDQAFTYISTLAFSADATGQLRYSGGMLMGSTDADADAEFVVILTGAPTVLMADLIL